MGNNEAYSRLRDACKEGIECLSFFKIEGVRSTLAECLTESLRIFNPSIVEKVYEALSKGKACKIDEECNAYIFEDWQGKLNAMQKYVLTGKATKDGVAEFCICGENGEYAFRFVFNGSSIFIALDRNHRWARCLPQVILGFCIGRGILDKLEAE